MIFFISPAKGFNEDTPLAKTLPSHLDRTKILVDELKKLNIDQVSSFMKIKFDMAKLNFTRFRDFKFDVYGSPAIYAYSGIQYKTIGPSDFSSDEIDFLSSHLRIISGLYGCIRPMDSIYPYRLEMQTRLSIGSLYDFWSDSIYQDLRNNSGGQIVNLASDEYSRAIKKYLDKDTILINCIFKLNKSGKLKIESTASKKARGLMVKYITHNKIDDYHDLINFSDDGYIFSKEKSKFDRNIVDLVFIKTI